jgi:hypothetical protein
MKIGAAHGTAIGSALLTVAVFACALVGCELLVDTSGLSEPKAMVVPPDGGRDSGPSAAPDAAVEASVEAGADACVAPEPTPLVPFGTLWTPRADARPDGTKTELSSATINSKGAIWSNEAVMFDAFDMTAGFELVDPNGDGSIADGFTFAWVPGEAIPDIGEEGGGLGVHGLTGYAVAIDTFTYPEPPPIIELLNPFLSADSNAWRLTGAPSPVTILGMLDGHEHVLRVRLEQGGIVTVWLDGKIAIDRFTIPQFSVFKGHWGFTAGTGDVTSVQRITRVSFVASTKACP